MEPAQSVFARHRLRCTSQRAVVFEALRATTSHPTAEELYHLARPRIGRLSLATVYNTLEVLCQAGLARKLPMGNGCCRYDADMSEHLHVRFRDTSEVVDVPEHLGRQLLQRMPRSVLSQIERAMGVKIDGVNIQLVASRD